MKLEEEIHQKKFRSPRHKLAVNLIYSYNWLINFHESVFKEHDITIQQYNVLRILRGQKNNPASIKLIKERMLDKMSDASRIVEKLRQKKLLERKICPSDRRNVEVKINENGLALLQSIDERENEFESFLSNLTMEEAETINLLLDKLRG